MLDMMRRNCGRKVNHAHKHHYRRLRATWMRAANAVEQGYGPLYGRTTLATLMRGLFDAFVVILAMTAVLLIAGVIVGTPTLVESVTQSVALISTIAPLAITPLQQASPTTMAALATFGYAALVGMNGVPTTSATVGAAARTGYLRTGVMVAAPVALATVALATLGTITSVTIPTMAVVGVGSVFIAVDLLLLRRLRRVVVADAADGFARLGMPALFTSRIPLVAAVPLALAGISPLLALTPATVAVLVAGGYLAARPNVTATPSSGTRVDDQSTYTVETTPTTPTSADTEGSVSVTQTDARSSTDAHSDGAAMDVSPDEPDVGASDWTTETTDVGEDTGVDASWSYTDDQ